MNDCHAIDDLITAFVDGEADARDRAFVIEHLAGCAACRTIADAESTARRILRTHAAAARTTGIDPVWRPHAFRLGRPILAASRLTMTAAVLLIALGGWALLARPTTVHAIGIIGDSFCAAGHPHPPGADEGRGCTLNCIKRGAEFVLVSGSNTYRIENQEFPDLAAWANARVTVSGVTVSGADGGSAIRVSRVDAVDLVASSF
jgi:hypothetical protein